MIGLSSSRAVKLYPLNPDQKYSDSLQLKVQRSIADKNEADHHKLLIESHDVNGKY